jgi:CHASE2 domain-containing sensor protein
MKHLKRLLIGAVIAAIGLGGISIGLFLVILLLIVAVQLIASIGMYFNLSVDSVVNFIPYFFALLFLVLSYNVGKNFREYEKKEGKE